MDGTKTWEPEDNVMDDELVDEFEEAEQSKAYGGATLSAGSKVEVKNEMEGFGNSWSAATIKTKKGAKFTVEYTAFLDNKKKPLSEEGVARKRLRLAPPLAPKNWSPVVGEIVEVDEDDCWWEAQIQSLGKGKASMKFRTSD
jgi:hypothetical protein